MMYMNILAVVTPPPIYNGCSTRKTFWEEKFTGKEIFFPAVNKKNGGRLNVRKYKEIKGSEKYVTLEISLKFDSLDKMKITSSESTGKLEISGKGLITSLGFKTKASFHKKKRQVIPSEMSVRRTFIRLLGSFRNLRNYLMRGRGPNMSLLIATFTQQDRLRSV